MKITLISPAMQRPRNVGREFHLPPMALVLIAAMTPPEIDVSLTDELIEPIDFDIESDLAGITVNTKTASRAYEIADELRNRGIPVVFGGIHPNVAKKEAIQHADAVVLGEAEGKWPLLLDDFSKGRMKKFYWSDKFPSFRNSVLPRRNLLKSDRYDTVNLVQTSRGCPYACQFCTVSSIYGKGVRLRVVDDVMEEILTLKNSDLFFVDDHVTGNTRYAWELFSRLIPLGKRWIGQASIRVADSVDLLKLLRQSGCEGLFIGLETNSTSDLKELGKLQNIGNDYCESIRRLHDNGISVMGSFMLGLDHDDSSSFEKLLEFTIKSEMDAADISILTPYPGTALFEKLKTENRLIDDAWWLTHDADEVVYQPKLMTRQELYEGRLWTLREIYKLGRTLKRWLRGFGRRTLFGNSIIWKANMGYRLNAYAEADSHARV